LKAVILAAGEGSRMRPLTYTRPKVMLPVANKPIMEHLLIEIKKAGINEVIIIVGYHDEQVRQYFGDGSKWGIDIKYCTQRKQMGTADAVKAVENLVDGNFLMVNGDVIIGEKEILPIISRNRNTMTVIEVEDTEDLGLVEVGGEKVIRIYEKVENPPSNLANTGLYMFTPEIFEAVSQTTKSPRGEYELTESLQIMIDHGIDILYQKIEDWLDISYPWDLLPANELILKFLEPENLGEIEDNVVIKGMVSIGESTIVRSGSYIVGPVVIGSNCDIGPNCYIRPSTSIGDNCHIGSAVELKNSIIMKSTKVPHHNYVGDSVIGEGCNLGAGTKIANLRLDKENIYIDGRNTKKRKLGAIIGDGVETGINSCINIGCIIGNNTKIGPGALCSGVIAPDSIIL
jgi:UDP-N-acetylglucosamine diphosphorylase/glucosamine-1-phosphate N-acetyltransferase